MNNRHIIFVYNANQDLFSILTDYVHKAVAPSTYQCNLCKLTHSNFGMKKGWKDFIDTVPGEKSFLYKDEFKKKYSKSPTFEGPAVYLEEKGILHELLSAAELNSYSTLSEMQQALNNKLPTT